MRTENSNTKHRVRQRFLDKSIALEKVVYKIAALQILALCISCGIGMYLTRKEIYWQQIFILPLHTIFLYAIIKLNNKWCNKIDEDFKH